MSTKQYLTKCNVAFWGKNDPPFRNPLSIEYLDNASGFWFTLIFLDPDFLSATICTLNCKIRKSTRKSSKSKLRIKLNFDNMKMKQHETETDLQYNKYKHWDRISKKVGNININGNAKICYWYSNQGYETALTNIHGFNIKSTTDEYENKRCAIGKNIKIQ